MLKNNDTTARILIAYDGSGYSHAILNELESSGLPHTAEVLIISVSEVWLPVKHQESEALPDRDLIEYFRKHLEQFEKNLAEARAIVNLAREDLLKFFPDWSIQVKIVSGSPAREILLKAGKFKPDLIVVGERGLSSDQDVGLGSTSQTVLAEAKCPVRISRFKPPADRLRLKILIGFDGSPGSMIAIKWAVSRAWQTKPEIRLVTVTDPFTLLKPGRVLQPIQGMSEGKIEGEQKWVQNLAVNALQLLRGAGLSATLHIYSGNPRMVLIGEATKWDADAVFIGATSGENRPEFYPLGCVASAIANRATCSVEVVREIM